MEIKNISKSYNGRKILDNVSFVFPERSVTGITGPSGRGKTTLTRILLGLTAPDSGDVVMPSHLRKGCVFQEDRLIEHMDSVHNVALTASRGITVPQIKQALASLGLDPENAEPVSKYSGGMRRRVAIARAVLSKPDILVLDEPFKGLDNTARETAAHYILGGCPEAYIIIVTHSQEELRLMKASKILELK